jgi:RNA polymerase sigma-70 factor, ECF subfamily
VEDRACSDTPATEKLPDADARLLEQIHAGDAEASRRFVREHYPAIYRYLLYLTRRPEQAEDLTQETFLQAWRHLGTFIARASLRAWLHRIARREFLQALRRQRAQTSLEEIAEAAEPRASAWMEAVELHEVIDRLPLPQREVVLLHYLEGYTSTEIARIVGAPVGTVCDRLARAREHLRQELGEDDLTYLNEPLAPMRQWAWLPLDQIYALEARLARGGDAKEEAMERREFLRQAAVGAVGLALSEPGKEVVDGRLTQKVTLAFKGTALADLCEHLRGETGVHVTAGPSVADEKVTLFCEKLPLREVMRQLSRPFGYTWVRSRKEGGEYRYELVQDLRSQLLEEELRNRDRNTALLALEKEIERFRPYLGLSPDEALARAEIALPEAKQLLQPLATDGWGPIQLYFRLSPQQLAALRAGQPLSFSEGPKPGHRPLPPDLIRGTLQCQRWRRIVKGDSGLGETPDPSDPRGVLLTAVPEAHAQASLEITQSEVGQFALGGSCGYFIGGMSNWGGGGPWAVGVSTAVLRPDNKMVNAKVPHDPALRRRVTIQPEPSCPPPAQGSGTPAAGSMPDRKATSADVMQALHRATGLPIVADYYTRLFPADTVSVQSQSLFDVLNQLTDTMHLRWNKEEDWLQFRSATFYNDRIKEVPNRLLSRWAASRRQHGALTLDDLLEIVQLPDAQLDAKEMAEGARECFGLSEWDLPCIQNQRPHLRYLAQLTPKQRRDVMTATGLPFDKMSLAQQQQFVTLALGSDAAPLQSLDELEGATLRVEYTVPGWLEWRVPGLDHASQLVVPLETGRRVPRPPVQERTREAALRALGRIDPSIREALIRKGRQADPRVEQAPPSEQAQIVPTELRLTIFYIPGARDGRGVHYLYSGHDEIR